MSIGYLRNLIILNCLLAKSIAFFFYPTFFVVTNIIISTMFFLLNVAIGNLPAYIYSLTSFAFLEHPNSGFCHTSETNILPFWYLSLGYTLLVSLPCFFPLNTWLVIDILSIKLEFYSAHATVRTEIKWTTLFLRLFRYVRTDRTMTIKI